MRLIRLCICVVFVLSLSGCMTSYWVENHPASHPGAVYTAEDFNITIHISPDSEVHKGTFVYNNETIDVVFSGIKLNSNVISMYSSEKELACWRYVDVYQDKFIVESAIKTEMFEEGDKVTFFKTSDGSLS